MQPSPYTPGELARAVPGRDRQVEDISAGLAMVAGFGELAGRIRIDVGPRGLGKTSLLREAERRARRLHLATVFVTAGNGPLLPDLVEGIAAAVDGAGAATWLGDLVAEAKLKLGVSGTGVEVTARPPAVRPAPSATRAFKELVANAARIARRYDCTGLVLFVDELQAADDDGLRTLAYTWQELQAERASVPAAVFAAGLSHTSDVVTDTVTFGERFAYRRLERLDEAAVREALTAPAAALGVTWRGDVLAEVVERAEGYPYVVQLYGHALWQAAGQPDDGGEVTTVHLRDAQSEVDDDLASLYRTRWGKGTRREQEFLAAMAGVDTPEVRRAEIADRLGVATTAVSMTRKALLDKGLIDSPRHGFLAFTVPGFAAYIRTVAEN